MTLGVVVCVCVRTRDSDVCVRACVLTRACVCVLVARITFGDGLMAAKQCNLKLPLIAKIMSRFCTSTDSVYTSHNQLR